MDPPSKTPEGTIMKVTSSVRKDGTIVLGVISESRHEETLLSLISQAQHPTVNFHLFASTDGAELSFTFAPQEPKQTNFGGGVVRR
jgi:hypothetical protein